MKRFNKKRVMITGAAGGIGRVCVKRFHDEGAEVIISDYELDAAEEVATECGSTERLHTLALDVTDATAVTDKMMSIVNQLGPIDCLINSAGIASIAGTPDLTPEDWRKVHAVNLDGTFYVSKAFTAQAMAQNLPACIVNLASVAGILAIPERPAYISSKHAVVGLTREMAMEFGTSNIRVNAVAPGIIRTAMSEAHFQDPDLAARICAAHALGRGGKPEEVAAAVAFLCSEIGRASCRERV